MKRAAQSQPTLTLPNPTLRFSESLCNNRDRYPHQPTSPLLQPNDVKWIVEVPFKIISAINSRMCTRPSDVAGEPLAGHAHVKQLTSTTRVEQLDLKAKLMFVFMFYRI